MTNIPNPATLGAVVSLAIVDAVGHNITTGDTIATLTGSDAVRGVVRRAEPDRLFIQRDDGLAAVLRPTGVLVLTTGTPIQTPNDVTTAPPNDAARPPVTRRSHDRPRPDSA
jgi:hypothetical protein